MPSEKRSKENRNCPAAAQPPRVKKRQHPRPHAPDSRSRSLYHRLCPDDRSDPADGNFAPPVLPAAPPPTRPEAGRDDDAVAGFEYELAAGFEYELEEAEAELLLKLVPAPFTGLAALTESPPPEGLDA